MDLSEPPLSEAHFVITFHLTLPVTYRISVYRPFTMEDTTVNPQESVFSIKETSPGLSPDRKLTHSLQDINSIYPVSNSPMVSDGFLSSSSNPVIVPSLSFFKPPPQTKAAPLEILARTPTVWLSSLSLPSTTNQTPNTRHILTSPVYIRYAFGFDPQKSARGLSITNHGLCLTHTSQTVHRRVGVTDEVLTGATFLWRVMVKSVRPNTPLVVGVMDSQRWMPGQSLTEMPGAIVIDLFDQSVFVNGCAQRIFRKDDQVAPLKSGDFVDFYLDCIQHTLHISINELPAKRITEIDNFPTELFACAELSTEGDSVQLEFPYPKLVADFDDDIPHVEAQSFRATSRSESEHFVAPSVTFSLQSQQQLDIPPVSNPNQQQNEASDDEDDDQIRAQACIPIETNTF